MSEPVLSVIMSVFNGEQYLEIAVNSILIQTLKDFEFIIVDDASSDGTPSILKKIHDPRVKVVTNEENLGLARSLQIAIQSANCEYLARQDADDFSEHTRLEKQLRFLGDNPKCGVVAAATRWVDQTGGEIKIWPTGQINSNLQENLLVTCPIIHGSVMIRRESYKQSGGYESELRVAQDYDLWLRMAEGWEMHCLDEVLYNYRWHSGMASHIRSAEQNANAAVVLARAIQRRKGHFWHILGLGPSRIMDGPVARSRQNLSDSYIYWSAGARSIGRMLALRFLLSSMLLMPATKTQRDYLSGIFRRKLGPGRASEETGVHLNT